MKKRTLWLMAFWISFHSLRIWQRIRWKHAACEPFPDIFDRRGGWMQHIVGIETVLPQFVHHDFVSWEIGGVFREFNPLQSGSMATAGGVALGAAGSITGKKHLNICWERTGLIWYTALFFLLLCISDVHRHWIWYGVSRILPMRWWQSRIWSVCSCSVVKLQRIFGSFRKKFINIIKKCKVILCYQPEA